MVRGAVDRSLVDDRLEVEDTLGVGLRWVGFSGRRVLREGKAS